ncbi:MAG TPA: hypothetical protein VGX02_02505 [Candidatus Eremiobacteraceae bacterium]|nr:hypothetical protein [Candidatus Eremiobacteraceae bacterium]
MALAVALVSWFSLHRDGYFASGDLFPGYMMPGNHVLDETIRLWGSRISGIGSPQFMPTTFLLALWGRLWLVVGLDGPTAQWLLYLAFLEFAGLSAVFFARALFPERRLIALTTGLAYPLCFYIGITFRDPINAFAFGYFPFSAALLMTLSRSPSSNARLAVTIGLASLGFTILASSPPIAVYALIWAIAWLVGSLLRFRTWQIWPGLALGSMVAVLVNAWWAYAAYITLYANGGSALQTFVGPLAWSFVDHRASILNMLSMQGLWSYDVPGYFPWTHEYASGFRLIALYLPAMFAALAILFSPYRRRVWLLVAICAVSLFLGKGYHQPFGDVNAFLYKMVPFFWLLRDPQEATGITLYLSLFTLAGVGVTQLSTFAGKIVGGFRDGRRYADAAMAGAWGLLMVLLVSNSIAVLRGDVIPATWLNGTAKSVLTPPTYWRQAADFLNAQPGYSRVLLLPNDDFYAMPYAWGYYGVDTVAQTWIERPVLVVAPDAFGWFGGSPALRLLYGQLLDEIRTGSSGSIEPWFSTLDVGWILQRNDVVWSSPERHIVAPSVINAYLRQRPAIRKVASFGALDLYRVDTKHQCASAYDIDAAGHGTLTELPITCVRRDSARYDVAAAPGTRALVLHVSYSPDWSVEADGKQLAWRHVSVDGLLNGWFVPDAAPLHVSLVYRPARLFHALQMLAIITVCVLLAGLALTSWGFTRRSG